MAKIKLNDEVIGEPIICEGTYEAKIITTEYKTMYDGSEVIVP